MKKKNKCESIYFFYHQKPLIGVKGRVQARVYEKDEVKKFATEIVSEKVTFLSSKKADE